MFGHPPMSRLELPGCTNKIPRARLSPAGGAAVWCEQRLEDEKRIKKLRTPYQGLEDWAFAKQDAQHKVRTHNTGRYWAGTQAKHECAAKGKTEHGMQSAASAANRY